MDNPRSDSDVRWLRKVDYFRIDEPSIAALRAFSPVVAEKLPEIIAKFYDHLDAFQERSPSEKRQTGMEKLKAAQTLHWLSIFKAEFTQDYKKELKKIGRLHHRYKIGSSTLLGGYAFIGSELLALAHREYSGFFGSRNMTVVSLERALMQVVLLNSQIVLSVYFKANAQERVRDIRAMVEKMEHEASTSLDDMGQLTKGVADSTTILLKSAEDSSESACTASSAAAEVVASAEVVAAATEQLRASIDEISHQVTHTRSISHDAAIASDENKQTVLALSGVVEQIHEFVDVIYNIAHQTNLLALNASIEAARSGESGRGFAVVANEVRELAVRTSEATRLVAKNIASVQDHTQKAVTVISESVKMFSRLDEAATFIASAIEEQTAVILEISHSMGDNAASAHRVSEIMEDLKQKSLETKGLSDDLSKDGKRIDSTIKVLKTGLMRVARTAINDADRRISARHGVLFPVSVIANGNALPGEMTNLSEHGCAISLAANLPVPGQSVSVDWFGEQRQAVVVSVDTATARLRFPAPLSASRVAEMSLNGAGLISKRAINDHLAFMETIYASMDGREVKKASDLANHHTCRFGRWYDSVSDKRMRECPSYAALDEPHHRVHTLGKKTLAALVRGDRAEAEASVKQAHQASEEVIRLLETLGKELEAETPSLRSAG